MLTEEELVRFNFALPMLMTDLEPNDILVFLQSKLCLTADDVEDIRSGITRIIRTEKLVDIIRRKLRSLSHLIEAVEKQKYHSLANALKNAPPENSPDFTAVNRKTLDGLISRGKIPKRPDVYVERTQILADLKEKLCQIAEDGEGWVVLHGMCGCGKSVLASECARDPSILLSVFPQIFWLKFSNRPRRPTSVAGDSSSVESDDDMLISVLNFLYQKTKVEPYFDRNNLEDALFRLAEVFERNFPRTLLVLDDISSSFHVQKMCELPCRFLATTRNESILGDISVDGKHKHSMTVDPMGFTKSETFDAFAKWLHVPVCEIPVKEAIKIYDECKGHPFVISLIGSLLRVHNNRWAFYYETLHRRRLSKLKTSDKSNLNYPFTTFDDAASCCIDELSDEYKSAYLDLAIFPLGVKISAMVLSVYWSKSVIDVEDLMDFLVDRQLVSKEEKKEGAVDEQGEICDAYSVHEMLHHFIKTRVDAERKKRLNRKLVENYRKRCGGRWFTLPYDSYIHWFFGFHSFRADMFEVFVQAYLDLRFLREKIKVCGVFDLLADFVRYSDCIDDEEEKVKFNEIRLFLCRNAHILSKSDVDFYQLALLEPFDSVVRSMASNILSTNSVDDQFYFVSLLENPVDERKQCVLTCTCHKGGGVRQALWLPRGGFVSVGEDKVLKVCSSRSCSVFQSINLPHPVNCIALHSDGSKALVATEDGLRLYDVSTPHHLHEGVHSLTFNSQPNSFFDSPPDRTPSPLLGHPPSFSGSMGDSRQTSISTVGGVMDEERDLIDSPGDPPLHVLADESSTSEILWCEISHNDCQYATGGRDRQVRLWNATSLDLMHVFDGHEDVVRCVKFGHDDSTLASCSDDRTVKVWNLMRRQLMFTFYDHRETQVSRLCFIPLCKLLASAGSSTVLVWNPESTESASKGILCCNTGSDVESVDASVCGKFLATGLTNFSIVVWRIKDTSRLFVIRGHSGWIRSVQFSPCGERLLSASDDGTAAIWKIDDVNINISRIRLSQTFSFFVDENERNLLVGASIENNLVLMEMPSMKVVATSPKQASKVLCLCVSPLIGSEHPLIVGYENGGVTAFFIKTSPPSFANFKILPGHKKATTFVCYSVDGSYLASGSGDGDINVWKSEERKPKILKGHSDEIIKLKFIKPKQESQCLVSASYDGGLAIWNVESGDLVSFIRAHDDRVLDMDVNMNETHIGSASADKTLKVWALDSGQKIFEAELSNCVRTCRFSSSGCFLMVGTDDGNVSVYTTDSYAIRKSLTNAHNTWVTDAAFSPDDVYFLTVSNCIKFWSIMQERCLQTYPLAGSLVKSVLALDGFAKFLTVDYFGNVHLVQRLVTD